MNNPTSRASRRVRFEEVTPAHEYAAFFSVSISPLVAHLGLPIFDGYDDLDDLQLAFLTLPSGETVTLGEYAGMPGTSLYIEVAMQSIPQIIFESCQQLRVSRQEIEWVHPNRQVEFDRLYAKHDGIDGIVRSSTPEELLQSREYEPIDCFYHALEIYTRPKFPEHWAMLQHNLGLAYFDRIKGERWENLQRSIQCFHNSLAVFKKDKFQKKWQINQEDLSQSMESWQSEKQNLVKDILNHPLVSRDLFCTDLSITDLMGAELIDANLTGANLSGARLNGANLELANLLGAKLIDATLSFANLIGANLDLANLSGTQVYKAKFGSNQGISELMKKDLEARGAIFQDAPGDRSESRTLFPR